MVQLLDINKLNLIEEICESPFQVNVGRKGVRLNCFTLRKEIRRRGKVKRHFPISFVLHNINNRIDD